MTGDGYTDTGRGSFGSSSAIGVTGGEKNLGCIAGTFGAAGSSSLSGVTGERNNLGISDCCGTPANGDGVFTVACCVTGVSVLDAVATTGSRVVCTLGETARVTRVGPVLCERRNSFPLGI